MITLFSEPTTAKGIICCDGHEQAELQQSIAKTQAYPNRLVQVNLLLVILIGIEGIQTNVVVDQLFPNLRNPSTIRTLKNREGKILSKPTLNLNLSLSSNVKLSLFAITGTTLTTSLSFFITMTSMGRSAWPVGLMKYKQQWMRVSWM
jgi:hypothetical protein